MLFSTTTTILALLAPLVAALPSTPTPAAIAHPDAQLVSSSHNLTERTFTSAWTADRCDSVQGVYGFWPFQVKFNLGCICYSDVDTFCRTNGLNSDHATWIRSQLSSCSSFKYPTGSQPTCDDKGGYTCPIAKNADGTCGTRAVSCGDSQCLQSDGTCCPRGTVKVNGQCCAKTCSGTVSGQCSGAATCAAGQTLNNGHCCTTGWTGYVQTCCPSGQKEDPNNLGTCICTDVSKTLSTSGSTSGTCVSKCTSSQSWCTTKCCKSYQTETSGTCGCPAGQTDNGSACVATCTNQQTYNTATGKCDAKCGYPLVWSSSSSNSAGMCCDSGKTCQKTVCCAVGQIESAGHCCAAGSTWVNGACRAASGTSKKRRALAGKIISQKPLDKALLNLDEKLCPKALSACPISGAATGSYECLDSFTDINSCGGCASLGRGQDCTTISGAKWMGCERGSCVVYSCRPGFKLVNGNSCQKV